MLLILCGILAIAALIGLFSGLRGVAIDSHPLCARCRFDLIGGSPSSGRCPECGADLTLPNTTRTGNRRTRRALVTASTLVLLLSAGVPTALWLSSSQSINALKPNWLLMLESRGGSSRSGAAAVAELNTRWTDGKLTDDQVTTLIARAIALQANHNRPWAQDWGDFLDAAIAKSRLSDAQRQSFARHAADLSFAIRRRIHSGQPVAVEMNIALARGGKTTYITVSPSLASITGDGVAVSVQGGSGSMGMMGPGAGRMTTSATLTGPLGTHIGESLWKVSITLGQGSGPPTSSFEIREPVRIEIVPDDQALVALADNDALHAAMEAAFKTPRISARASGFDINVTVTNAPATLGHALTLRDADGREWPVGTVTLAGPGTGQNSMGFGFPIPDGFTAHTVDVILRPSPETTAASSATIESIWGGTLEFKNVPVGWPAASSDAAVGEGQAGGGPAEPTPKEP